MIPTTGISTIGREKAPLTSRFKGHTKIISHGINRETHIFYFPPTGYRIQIGTENIKSSHTGMTIRRKVQLSFRAKCRKHFVTRCINIRSQIVYIPETVLNYIDPPQIESAVSSRHIRNKIKKISLRRHSRMSHRRERIIQNSTLSGCSPIGSGS